MESRSTVSSCNHSNGLSTNTDYIDFKLLCIHYDILEQEKRFLHFIIRTVNITNMHNITSLCRTN